MAMTHMHFYVRFLLVGMPIYNIHSSFIIIIIIIIIIIKSFLLKLVWSSNIIP